MVMSKPVSEPAAPVAAAPSIKPLMRGGVVVPCPACLACHHFNVERCAVKE